MLPANYGYQPHHIVSGLLLQTECTLNISTHSYATLLFERLGLDDVKSRIIAACNGTEYFLASLVAIALIDRIGRRRLMLFGAVAQMITMILLAVLGSVDTSAAQIVSAVLLFVFNSFFAVGWLGMTWLYVRPGICQLC